MTKKQHFKPARWRCSSRSLLCCLSRQFLQHQAWQCVVRQTIRTEQLSTLNEGKMTLCVLSYCTHSRTWSNHSTARMTLMLTSQQCPSTHSCDSNVTASHHSLTTSTNNFSRWDVINHRTQNTTDRRQYMLAHHLLSTAVKHWTSVLKTFFFKKAQHRWCFVFQWFIR